MFSFLETICIENGYPKNLFYHQKRVNETFECFFQGMNPLMLESIFEKADLPKQGIYRCRIIYDEEIQSLEFITYQEKNIRTLKIVDTEDFDYGFKWSDRSYFQQILKENPTFDEVIFHKNGFIQDCSIANLALLKEGIWYTPKNPMHWGTTRSRLIDEQLIQEHDIKVSELHLYSHICLINVFRSLSIENSIAVSLAIL